ncbi:MAG TPA: diacylglycerol kinase family protein [Longimicrobium sp.]|jgi:diacylglycerol kinase family enzyme|uniref:diacylglycerol/lipid kinase family protein n=1 Tax=Longimicrobium sp. TaxID=2029185 RepID=UPI002ED8EE8C
MTNHAAPLPVYLNPASGSAPRVLAAVRTDARFEAHELGPGDIREQLREAARSGAGRIVVAGGDGTVLCAAEVAAQTGVELAVLPGGTLNHFSHDLGLPVDDMAACLEVAATGVPRRMDLGEVNGNAILNSSSVGAYVTFVRTRERLERRGLSYRTASVLGALRVWRHVRGMRVEMRTGDGKGAEWRRYHSPMVYVGIGERDLERLSPSTRLPGGRPALHVMIARPSARGRVAALAWSALRRGLDATARTDLLDTLLVEECVVHLRREHVTIGIDGELVKVRPPLHFRLNRGAFTVIAPRRNPDIDGRTE